MFAYSPRRIGRFAAVVTIVGVIATLPASAETIFVTDSIDAIPAPPGTLRWAIEVSNENGKPDEIVFLIDVARIDLVAPLPALTDGGLTLGNPPAPDDPQPRAGSLTLHGGGTVPGAMSIASGRNVLANIRFEGFVGPTILRVEGENASDNVIAGCGFFGPGPDGLTREGVRIAPDNGTGRLPANVVIRHSMFDGLSTAIVVEGLPGSGGTPNPPFTAIARRSWFGLTETGQPSQVGNLRAVEATVSGPVAIQDNVVAGPGTGFLLERADRSRIAGNEIGVSSEISAACFGMSGAGIEVLESSGVTAAGNRVRCSGAGILLGTGTRSAHVRGNRLGSRLPGEGNVAEGILLEGVAGSEIVSNVVIGNGGAGIESRNPGEPGTTLSCNRILANGGPPILAPDVTTPPPVLLGADEISVRGELPDNLAALVEVFGDDGDGPDVFQGTADVTSGSAGFRHLLPVLDLSFVTPTFEPGTAFIFATADPSLHVATSTAQGDGATSEVSGAIGASAVDPVYDVVRGNLRELARSPGGGVDLGDVVCLAPAISASDLPVLDATVPSAGDGFFYVVRRRSALVENVGTYDPAVCVSDAATFTGPRVPASGDCGM